MYEWVNDHSSIVPIDFNENIKQVAGKMEEIIDEIVITF